MYYYLLLSNKSLSSQNLKNLVGKQNMSVSMGQKSECCKAGRLYISLSQDESEVWGGTVVSFESLAEGRSVPKLSYTADD